MLEIDSGHRFRKVKCLAPGHTGTLEDLYPRPSMSTVPLCGHLPPLTELSREDSPSLDIREIPW